jgi:hypothetical protein
MTKREMDPVLKYLDEAISALEYQVNILPVLVKNLREQFEKSLDPESKNPMDMCGYVELEAESRKFRKLVLKTIDNERDTW